MVKSIFENIIHISLSLVMMASGLIVCLILFIIMFILGALIASHVSPFYY